MRVAVNRMRGSLVLAALCAALGACASGSRADQARRQAAQPRTTLRVDNQNFLDMTIYVVWPSRVRLGLAPGKSTTTFVIPPIVVGQGNTLRFLADPIGSRARPVTDEIVVSPGDEVTLMIPPT
jgi:hypothetical protein